MELNTGKPPGSKGEDIVNRIFLRSGSIFYFTKVICKNSSLSQIINQTHLILKAYAITFSRSYLNQFTKINFYFSKGYCYEK